MAEDHWDPFTQPFISAEELAARLERGARRAAEAPDEVRAMFEEVFPTPEEGTDDPDPS